MATIRSCPVSVTQSAQNTRIAVRTTNRQDVSAVEEDATTVTTEMQHVNATQSAPAMTIAVRITAL